MREENKEIVIIDGRTGFRMNQRNEKPKDEKPIANAIKLTIIIENIKEEEFYANCR